MRNHFLKDASQFKFSVIGKIERCVHLHSIVLLCLTLTYKLFVCSRCTFCGFHYINHVFCLDYISNNFAAWYDMQISVSFLADRFAICLFCRNSKKCEMSSMKRDFPLSEVLLPITIIDLIGIWKFKYSHASHLAPYMVVA